MATGRVPTTANSPLTAKGDLFGYSTTQARVPVGSDGETLVADSSASTGLRWQQPKTQNGVYNSGFDIAQRGTSFTGLSGAEYTLDRWVFWSTTAGQSNYASQQSAGNLSVSPNQAVRYCGRFGRTNGTTNTGRRIVFQTLETADSLKYAGQTITVSFYARAGANYSAASNVLGVDVSTGTGTDQIYYSFTGLTGIGLQNKTLTTSWQRFTWSGTVGTTATELALLFVYDPLGTAGAADYFEITGVQLEIGSVATPYSRQSATLAGELAACQRYYYRQGGTNVYETLGSTWVYTATNAISTVALPVSMRVIPTSIEYSTIGHQDSGGIAAATNAVFSSPSRQQIAVELTTGGGLTVGRAGRMLTNNSTNGYIAFSAEL